jgi:hypothetical protein
VTNRRYGSTVEHPTHNRGVAGSNPVSVTNAVTFDLKYARLMIKVGKAQFIQDRQVQGSKDVGDKSLKILGSQWDVYLHQSVQASRRGRDLFS